MPPNVSEFVSEDSANGILFDLFAKVVRYDNQTMWAAHCDGPGNFAPAQSYVVSLFDLKFGSGERGLQIWVVTFDRLAEYCIKANQLKSQP